MSMRIVGNKDNVNEILLIHKGNGLRFQCITKQLPHNGEIDYDKRNVIEITFDDLREVDNLIDILARFRSDMQEYLGIWRGKREYEHDGE